MCPPKNASGKAPSVAARAAPCVAARAAPCVAAQGAPTYAEGQVISHRHEKVRWRRRPQQLAHMRVVPAEVPAGIAAHPPGEVPREARASRGGESDR